MCFCKRLGEQELGGVAKREALLKATKDMKLWGGTITYAVNGNDT